MGCNEEQLIVQNISADVDGWKAVCRFSNAAGKSYTTAAVIHVGVTLSPEVLAEFNTTDSIRIIVQPKSDPAYTGENLNFFSEAEPITSGIIGNWVCIYRLIPVS